MHACSLLASTAFAAPAATQTLRSQCNLVHLRRCLQTLGFILLIAVISLLCSIKAQVETFSLDANTGTAVSCNNFGIGN